MIEFGISEEKELQLIWVYTEQINLEDLIKDLLFFYSLCILGFLVRFIKLGMTFEVLSFRKIQFKFEFFTGTVTQFENFKHILIISLYLTKNECYFLNSVKRV